MKRLFTLILLFTTVTCSWADDLIDGIYYNLNGSDKTASVISGSVKYKGNVIIPSTINKSGVEYKVVSVGYMAFLTVVV